LSNYAADDYNAIYERLRALQPPCPTAQALIVDIKWYEEEGARFAYRAVSTRAATLIQSNLKVDPDGYARWVSVDPTDFRRRLNVPEDYVFEEIPRP